MFELIVSHSLQTSACIHETDDNRNCEKNGPHCAFGHGHDDLRAPIFDATCGPEAADNEIHARLNPDDNKVIFEITIVHGFQSCLI